MRAFADPPLGHTGCVAVDEQRRRDDLYDVTLRPHDERVEAGGWTYYVRGVRDNGELLPRLRPTTGDLLVDGALLVSRGIKRLTRRKDRWTVGVVRLGSVSTWNNVQPQVVHREALAPGQEPEPRVAELIAEVKVGRHAPEQ